MCFSCSFAFMNFANYYVVFGIVSNSPRRKKALTIQKQNFLNEVEWHTENVVFKWTTDSRYHTCHCFEKKNAEERKEKLFAQDKSLYLVHNCTIGIQRIPNAYSPTLNANQPEYFLFTAFSPLKIIRFYKMLSILCV